MFGVLVCGRGRIRGEVGLGEKRGLASSVAPPGERAVGVLPVVLQWGPTMEARPGSCPLALPKQPHYLEVPAGLGSSAPHLDLLLLVKADPRPHQLSCSD